METPIACHDSGADAGHGRSAPTSTVTRSTRADDPKNPTRFMIRRQDSYTTLNEENAMSTQASDRRAQVTHQEGEVAQKRTPSGHARARSLLVSVLACALLALTANAIAAKSSKAPVKGATYTGSTSERVPVTFKVAKNGKRIQGFTTRLGYNGQCGQGGGPSFEIKIASIAIRAGGKFAASTKGTFSGATVHVPPIAVKVSGRIAGRSAGGAVFEPGKPCTTLHKGKLPYSETFTATAA
jgi:hypothetical protein